MRTNRRLARNYLDDSSLTNFWDIVREAKILKQDYQILEARFVDGDSIVEISQKYGYTEEKINRVIATAYDKVSRLL